MPSPTPDFLRYFLGSFALAAALAVSFHAILRRRNPHAAAWWILVAWTLPVAGAILYGFFGINRIERKAAKRRRSHPPKILSPNLTLANSTDVNVIPFQLRHLLSICRVVEKIARKPLTRGNQISPLFNGDEAFPAMISAIDHAERSVGLSTYIFESDAVGQRFISALAGAVKRGVAVRVLIDDVGSGFQWKSIDKSLTRQSVPVAYFMPTLVPWRMAYMNMRNHRKILTVDGRIAFSGGMNITWNHALGLRPPHPAQDVHFQIEGPVVAQLQETFREDWHYSVGENLGGEAWFPALYENGLTLSRGIADGPDEDFEKCKLTLLGALAAAERSIRIVTPYLIPDASLISALNVAAMSGVKVDVVLPTHSDMAVVNWATQAILWQLLQRGVRIWRTPGAFNHAKLMVVDGGWTFFGSSNWDARSLRLNFEFNVEKYGSELAERIEKYIDEQISLAHQVTLAEVDARPLPTKLRDGIARLFSPLL